MKTEKFRRATEEEREYLARLSPALQPKEGPEYWAVKALLNLAKSKGLDWRFLFEVAVATQPKEWPKPPLSAVAPCDTLKEPPSQIQGIASDASASQEEDDERQEEVSSFWQALKDQIRSAQTTSTPQRVYQPSGVEYSLVIDVPPADSLDRIQSDALLLRPETEITMGIGSFGARIMTICDRPKLDSSADQASITKLLSISLAHLGADQSECYCTLAIKHSCSPAHSLVDSRRHVPSGAWKYCEEFELGESVCERDYRPEDLEGCSLILLREVLVVRPTVLVAFGGLAAKTLLDTHDTVAELRNRLHTLRINGLEFPVLVTFDLEYLHFLKDHLGDFMQDLDLLKIYLEHLQD